MKSDGGWWACSMIIAFIIGMLFTVHLSMVSDREHVEAGTMIVDKKTYRVVPFDAH